MTSDTDAFADLFEHASLGAPENSVGFVLWRVMHRYQRSVDRALAPLDLTHLQFTVLAMAAWLCHSGEAATQADLARRADIHAMQVSLMLKALEGKAMVERPRSTTDPRTKHVNVTPCGLAALRAALPIIINIQQCMFGAEGAPDGALLNGLRNVENRNE